MQLKRATRPPSCTNDWFPSRIFMWVVPISWKRNNRSTCLRFFYLDKIQFQTLWHVKYFHNLEKSCDDVDAAVAHVPHLVQNIQSPVNFTLRTVFNQLVDEFWVGLVAHLKVIAIEWTLVEQGLCEWKKEKCATLTLKTFTSFTSLNPEWVDWRLLMAWRMSPSEVKINASSPSAVYTTYAP